MNRLLEDLIKVMTLERLELDLFRGESRDIGSPQVFGGQVLGQALMAATATVEERVVHSLHAYFLRRGDFNAPIVYEVDRARDGNHFSTRRSWRFSMARRYSTCRPRFKPRRAGSIISLPCPMCRRPRRLPDLESHYRRCAGQPAGGHPADTRAASGRSNFGRCSRRVLLEPQKSIAAEVHLVPGRRYRCRRMRRCTAACWPMSRISICSTRP